jgi:hypothetical protein
MRRLVSKVSDLGRDDSDVREIVAACQRRGYEISPSTAHEAWDAFSDSMSAGWMNLPSVYDRYYDNEEDLKVPRHKTQDEVDGEIVETIMSYVNEVDEY